LPGTQEARACGALLPVPVLGAVIGTVYAARYGIKKMEDIAEELHMQQTNKRK
jgi:hypothetical protein